jgi:hypothetical protein
MMSPARPLMANVDSSTSVTSPELESSCATEPAYVHGSAIRRNRIASGSRGQTMVLEVTGAGDRPNWGLKTIPPMPVGEITPKS